MNPFILVIFAPFAVVAGLIVAKPLLTALRKQSPYSRLPRVVWAVFLIIVVSVFMWGLWNFFLALGALAGAGRI